MKWTFSNDDTPPIITAEKHINSHHGTDKPVTLPETCVMFEMGKEMRFIESNYETISLYEKLPCFLDSPKCLSIRNHEGVCFTKGGYGAPAAVDTLETVLALGAKRIIIVGLCGGFADNINVGSVVVPKRILCEEGTSFHYYEDIEFAEPDMQLFDKAKAYFSDKQEVLTNATVTSDSFYRQTFAKEAYWRQKECVGVDMEASALLSVCKYYNVPAVVILLCSDKHPMSEHEKAWNWGNLDFIKIREDFVRQSINFALQL